MFAAYYKALEESGTTYKISAKRGEDGTPSAAGQFFNLITNEIGLGEDMHAYTMAQELFHAFQKFSEAYSKDKPTPWSTIETEGDIATMYVMSEAGLGMPVYGDWGADFLLESFEGPPSMEKVQSDEYQKKFQAAVDARIKYYQGAGMNAPTYTAPNTGVKPKAFLEKVIELMMKK